MPQECDWGDGLGKLQDGIFRKILICSRPFLLPTKKKKKKAPFHYDC